MPVIGTCYDYLPYRQKISWKIKNEKKAEFDMSVATEVENQFFKNVYVFI